MKGSGQMSIGAINSHSTHNLYAQLSSGRKVNRAADNAAAFAIIQKVLKEENGLNVGTQNAWQGTGVINVADGAMSGISDSLQRMNELGIYAQNGLLSDSDREMVQMEVDQLKDDIQFMSQNTSLNEKKLLDGSMADMQLATNPRGGGMSIQMADTTLESLGIADFDVTKDFDLDAISGALEKVSHARSKMGASANGLEHVRNYNDLAAYNLTASRSRMEDTDMAEAASKLKTNRLLEHFEMMLQKQNQNQKMKIMGIMM